MCDLFDETTGVLIFNKVDDLALFPWVDLGAPTPGTLAREAGQMYFSNGGVDAVQPPFSLADFEGNLFIWGHGSNQTTNIYKDGDQLGTTPRELANQLRSWGLPPTFARNIVVWACWGGRPGGLAELLYEELVGLGFPPELRVWGFDGITCNMRSRQLFLLDDVEVPETLTTEQMEILAAVSQLAKKRDFLYYGPTCPQ